MEVSGQVSGWSVSVPPLPHTPSEGVRRLD